MKRLILFLVFFPTFALGDPGPATRFLMNEPASLMDVGLAAMARELRSGDDSINERMNAELGGQKSMSMGSSATYDFLSDEIQIHSNVYYDGTLGGERCKYVIKSWRGYVAASLVQTPIADESSFRASKCDAHTGTDLFTGSSNIPDPNLVYQSRVVKTPPGRALATEKHGLTRIHGGL